MNKKLALRMMSFIDLKKTNIIHRTYTFNDKQFMNSELNSEVNIEIFDIIEFCEKLVSD
ncbi:MAG: hypothetical protein J5723_07595 [Ruminococcus sp.]|nr:hypothetical protein [Ruminococcus sp.]